LGKKAEAVMICPACQAENPADSRFCRWCGSSFAEPSGTLTIPESEKAKITEDYRFSPGDKFGERYTIIEEVGRGGMGTAYKAEDRELGTVVVLKMIRAELASKPHIVEQFKKETLLGRTITHENVIRIHDIGEINNIKYISMDYVKGENLSELIHTSGTLTLATCLNVTRQIAQALRAAHRKGIIHQDLKPSNVMIDNSGRVFVTDFGLARSVAVARELPGKRLIGTPRYFSPEQARGEESDQRSDIYSLGIMMYEMVTGAPPFEADTTEGYIHKHISQRPVPPSRVNPALPSSCEKVILKCLEKKREDRYQSADELLADLEALKSAGLGAAPMARWKKLLPAVSAAVLMLVLILWVFFFKPSSPPPRPAPTLSNSVAVLYAVNNSGDKSLDKLLRWGISSLLTTDLAASKYLRIFPEDQLMQVLESMGQLDEAQHLSKTLETIADKENVEYFVLPSFTKVGDKLRIDFKVRRARAKEILGAAFVQGRPEDLFSLVDELSLKVKAAVNLSPAEIAGDYSRKLDEITTNSLEALRHYVEGERLYTLRNFEASVQSFKKAVEEDPDYALAHLALAEDYIYLGDYEQHKNSLRRALALVDRVSERDRYIIQGYASSVLDESPLPAIQSYKKLIELYPQDELGYVHLGSVYRNLEEWDQAIEQYENVLKINSRSMYYYDNRAFICTSQGQYEKAVEILETARKLFPGEPDLFVMEIVLNFLIQGRYREASRALKNSPLSPDDPRFLELQGHLSLLSEDMESAQRVYERLRQKEESDARSPGFLGLFWLAHLHLLQGRFSQSQNEILTGIRLAQKSKRPYEELDFRLLHAYSRLQLGRFAESIEALKPALEICQNVGAVHSPKFALVMSGMAQLGMGHIEEAQKTANELLKMIEVGGAPKHMRYYNYLMGRVALAENNPAGAVRYFGQAISTLPAQREEKNDHAFYYDGLASAHYQSGDYAKARDAYERILSLTTGRLNWGDIYARAHYWLGKISQKMGNAREATAHFEKFLKMWEKADPGLTEVSDTKAQLARLGKTS